MCRMIRLGGILAIMATITTDFSEWQEQQEELEMYRTPTFILQAWIHYASWTLPTLRSWSVQPAAGWLRSSAYRLLPVPIPTAARILFQQPQFPSGIGPSGPDTPVSVTSSTSFTNHHPRHLIAAENSPASPTSSASPSLTPLHLILYTIYPLGSLQAMEKPNTWARHWSSRNLHKNQEGSWTTLSTGHWLGGWRFAWMTNWPWLL